MKYDRVISGTFISRPNRFIAYCEIDGSAERCHVKNTGRCRELLVPGTKVYLSVSDDPSRSTGYDLIAVMKGNRLINMDSQIPNGAAAEGLRRIPLFSDVTDIRREFRYGDSRIDIMASSPDRRYLIEVKGVTLEENGIVMFPDAPTERGTKHLRELMGSVKDGYVPCILFVIQMDDVRYFEPNAVTDPVFARTLREAASSGVEVLAYTCRVTPDSMTLDSPVEVRLS
ncbi:MAG: DNA/RNA nuclease SfsA [Candidatus Methanomethylophilaceae archaeon]